MSTGPKLVTHPAVRWLLTAALSVALAGLTMEIAFRSLSFTPRVQIVRDGVSGRNVTVVPLEEPATDRHSAPSSRPVALWDAGPEDLVERNESCPKPGSVDVLLAGDSVFRVTNPEGRENTFAWMLQQSLLRDHPGVCVVNVAESGYAPEQVFAEIQRAHRRFGVESLVVGVFKTAGRYARFQGAWIEVNRYALDGAGVPLAPWAPGGAVHDWLFNHSRAWQYATLTTGVERVDPAPFRDYEQIAAWAHAEHVPVTFVRLPWLNQPFAESAAHPLYDLSGIDAPVVDAASAWVDVDVTTVRNDDCCHYNVEGHRHLHTLIEPIVRASLWGDVAGAQPTEPAGP